MFSRKVTRPSRVPQGYSTIPRPYPRFTSYLYKVYETIPPLVTSWYTIWAKVIVIVATYRVVVTYVADQRADKTTKRTIGNRNQQDGSVW